MTSQVRVLGFAFGVEGLGFNVAKVPDPWPGRLDLIQASRRSHMQQALPCLLNQSQSTLRRAQPEGLAGAPKAGGATGGRIKILNPKPGRAVGIKNSNKHEVVDLF